MNMIPLLLAIRIGGEICRCLYLLSLKNMIFQVKQSFLTVPMAGSRFSNTVAEIAELQPNAVVSDNGFLVERNDVINCADDVIDWINSIF